MSNTIGERYRFTIWGQSHAPAIGVTIEGLPVGFKPDMDALQAFLSRRAPGNTPFSTPRKEADAVEILSGLSDGMTCGAPLTAIIRNTNTRSGDYDELRRIPRPGHADYPAFVRFGNARDVAGGGQFSGRLTAPLCIAGGLALQILSKSGMDIHARITMIGGETDPNAISNCLNRVKDAGDSVGGVIECICENIPAGLGDPMFDGMENRIARLVFGIPAVKGIEFGDGFRVASMTGSENNDAYYYDPDGRVRTRTNHAGGILGGITNGAPIVFRAAFKPTPSIGLRQDSVDLAAGTNTQITVHGRHDPCIVIRAVPIVEAAAACAILDAMLEAGNTIQEASIWN